MAREFPVAVWQVRLRTAMSVYFALLYTGGRMKCIEAAMNAFMKWQADRQTNTDHAAHVIGGSRIFLEGGDFGNPSERKERGGLGLRENEIRAFVSWDVGMIRNV